jgi:hypothetical protein
MNITFQEVNIEDVQKGKSRYQIANVTYTTSGGQNRQQKLLSFANPESFKAVQGFKQGDVLEVTITKNAGGYDQWAKVEKATAAASAGTPATNVKPVSNYETREERQERQLHIVRQSSLSNAVNMLTPGAKAALKVEDVIAVAEQLVDFVYDNSLEDLDTPNGEISDIPY